MDDPPKKKSKFSNKFFENKKLKAIIDKLWDYRIEIFSGALLLAGIIVAFFSFHFGGVLVGLGFGICFFEEMHQYFIQLRDLFSDHGIFKTLMIVGVIIYFLIAIPAFVVASAVGYGAMYIIRAIANS